MKAFLVAAGILLSAAAANSAPCLPGSLQSYIDLGMAGCSEGTLQFSNFATAPGLTGATVVDPTQVQVNPGGSALQFTLGDSAGAGELLDLLFRFNVAAPAPLLGTFSLAGASAMGDGAVTGIEDVCFGASFPGSQPSGCPTQSDSLVVFATDGFSDLVASRSFPASSFFDVFVNLTLDGGLSGSASLGSASVRFAPIPEPSTYVLVLSACGLIVLARRRQTLVLRGSLLRRKA